MPQRRTHPDGALYLATYARLHEYLLAFAGGHLNLIILVGPPGTGKSRSVRDVLGNACWIEGNATPFGMYEKLYRHRGRFVIIDDVDSLYADKAGVRLLKCLCQTEEEKAVAWHTDARGLEKRGIPREFTTESRVIIICNDWKTLNRNVAALQDRGHVLMFQPSAAEVHRQASQWFDDPEIYAWIGVNLHRMREPSFRHYVRARELKAAGMDWTEVLAEGAENQRARLAAEILASSAYHSTGEMVRAFVRGGGGCRATFFNYRRRLANSTGGGSQHTARPPAAGRQDAGATPSGPTAAEAASKLRGANGSAGDRGGAGHFHPAGKRSRDGHGPESDIPGGQEAPEPVPAPGDRHRSRLADGLPERPRAEALALQTAERLTDT